MAYKVTTETTSHIGVTTDSGERVVLTNRSVSKGTYYNVRNINGRISMIEFFEVQSLVCKSSSDITLLKELLSQFDYANKATFPSAAVLSQLHGMSETSIKGLIKRACMEGLFAKLANKSYFLNPFLIMSVKLSSAGYQMQEEVQSEWLKLTSHLTKSDLDAVIALNTHLHLPKPLPTAEYVVEVARYFIKHGSITDRQYQALLKFI